VSLCENAISVILGNMEIFLNVLIFVLGALLVLLALLSAIRSFVVPRSDNVFLTRLVFLIVNRLLQLRLRWLKTYAQRDKVMAFYAPITLLILPVVWLFSVLMGYTCMFWALGVGDQALFAAFNVSGSSLLTLGFATVDGWVQTALTFSEAVIGLGLMALLIAYLPTMYAAFAKRETFVTMLEVRAGSPPWAITFIERLHRISGLESAGEAWMRWEVWFVELGESHTSLAPLIFFRSPYPDKSWVTAAGAVLDAAAIYASTLDIPRDARAELCLRAGYLTLQSIADFFEFDYARDFMADDPEHTQRISIPRAEFEAACDHLAAQGVPLKLDREQAWQDFAGWRVNYDAVLLALCRVTMAAPAPWSSDLVEAE
jgi:hypothetical protein